DEQYCLSFPTLTYNAEDKHLGGVTYGGDLGKKGGGERVVLRGLGKIKLEGGGPPLLRGFIDGFPVRGREGGGRNKKRHRGGRWTGPHGPEVCEGVWSACGSLYDLGRESSRRKAAWSGRSGHFERRGRDAKACEQL